MCVPTAPTLSAAMRAKSAFSELLNKAAYVLSAAPAV